jgi:serine/threonine protein kinase
MAPDPQPVRELFLAAVELPAIDRAAYLDAHCADAELRAAVERLLAAQQEPASILKPPVVPTGTYVPIAERVGSVIGPYKLMEQIGEGGFGLVFVAEQHHPVRRKVALKLIKPGMDSALVIARFEAERQALALMDHPHIAKVLDAGATDSGRPYFVMELVRGIPITEYCDKNQLAPRERLELFVTVCQAIQHAHQKGIIHRDVKPSNILVTSHDGRPVAKVIDFGVAKAMHQQLTAHSIYTNFAQMIGTPMYMSPEQAEMSGLDIDTRSDIYSLGVLLYELLTGTTPLERQRIAKAAYDEVRRLIREEEPQKPSLRLSSADALPSIAARRHTEPAKLSRLVRGDLDWITMKALEKDRTRRYETANGLARDIQRYLSDEPVEACPPSATYRLRKFAKKHRAALTTAVALALLLIGGIGVSSWQAVRATRAEAEANEAAEAARIARLDAEQQQEKALQSAAREAAERKKAEAARMRAQAKETEANAVVQFFEDRVFSAGRPKGEAGGLGHDVLLSDAVKASLAALGTSFTDQPLVEARLRYTLGRTLRYLGDYTQSAQQLEQARALFNRHAGPDHPDTLLSMYHLAISYLFLNRYDEALKLHEQTLAARKRVLPADHPDTLGSMNNVAISLAALNRHTDAVKLYAQALFAQKRVLPTDDPATLSTIHNLAVSYVALNRRAEALKLCEETLAARRRVLPFDHPDTIKSMTNLANSYHFLNRHAEALKLREEALAARRRVLPPDHPDTLYSMHCVGVSYAALNRHAEALKVYEETLAAQRRVLPADHPDTLWTMYSLARGYAALNRHAEAAKLHAETLAARKRVLYANHPDTLKSMNALAYCYASLGRHIDAVNLYEPTLAAQKRALPPDDPDTLWTMNNLALSYAALKRHAEAIKLHEETLAARKRALGPDHLDTLNSMANLAATFANLNRHAEAVNLLEATLAVQKRVLRPDHSHTLWTMVDLARSYSALGRNADAVGLIDEVLSKAKRPGLHPQMVRTTFDLRLRLFQKASDPAGCRTTAEMWEKLQRIDAASLYRAGCLRAATAAVQAKAMGPDAARMAHDDADQAMASLTRAIAAGYTDGAHMQSDADLAFLRDREDFRKLVAELEGKRSKK